MVTVRSLQIQAFIFHTWRPSIFDYEKEKEISPKTTNQQPRNCENRVHDISISYWQCSQSGIELAPQGDLCSLARDSIHSNSIFGMEKITFVNRIHVFRCASLRWFESTWLFDPSNGFSSKNLGPAWAISTPVSGHALAFRRVTSANCTWCTWCVFWFGFPGSQEQVLW